MISSGACDQAWRNRDNRCLQRCTHRKYALHPSSKAPCQHGVRNRRASAWCSCRAMTQLPCPTAPRERGGVQRQLLATRHTGMPAQHGTCRLPACRRQPVRSRPPLAARYRMQSWQRPRGRTCRRHAHTCLGGPGGGGGNCTCAGMDGQILTVLDGTSRPLAVIGLHQNTNPLLPGSCTAGAAAADALLVTRPCTAGLAHHQCPTQPGNAAGCIMYDTCELGKLLNAWRPCEVVVAHRAPAAAACHPAEGMSTNAKQRTAHEKCRPVHLQSTPLLPHRCNVPHTAIPPCQGRAAPWVTAAAESLRRPKHKRGASMHVYMLCGPAQPLPVLHQ